MTKQKSKKPVQKHRKVYTTSSGARYVWRVSKKSGNRWKQYIPRKTTILKSPNKKTQGLVYILGR